ncbi:MAG: hypothetical protein PVJ38_00670 [Candidatus Bathyarchaeota archaeon]|jgi:hypothetical protein
MRTEAYIRTTELGVTLASTYIAAVTMVRTSLYAEVRPWVMLVMGPLVSSLGGAQTPETGEAVVDLLLLGMAMALSFLFWRRGDEAGFGRLFSLNMLMFFPSVLDVSTFNWINLIFPYDPTINISTLWIFGVGLLLQATYLTLRYTVRFRGLREELEGRGALEMDVDEVSKGQMIYLAQLVVGSSLACAGVYYGAPYVNRLLRGEIHGLPYPHIIVGVVCIFLIAAGIILYLRGERMGAIEVHEGV